MDDARRSAAEKFLEKPRAVDGWLERADGLVLLQVSALQVQAGLRANLLEIGAYRGRSAILLGYLREPGERLFVCDTFEDQPPPSTAGLWVDGKRRYPGLTQSEFERNFARYHPDSPVIVRRPSRELLADGTVQGPLRLVHVDGDPAALAQDIATARALLAPGGVAIFEDDHSLHNPAVAPAVLQALERDDLRPLCMTPWKLYVTSGPDVLGLQPALQAWAQTAPDFRPTVRPFAGRDTLLLYPPAARPGPCRGLDRKARL